MEIRVFIGAINFEIIIESFLNLLKCSLPSRQSGNIDKFWACIPISTTNPKLASNCDVIYGNVMLYFIPIEDWSGLNKESGHPDNGKHQGRQGI